MPGLVATQVNMLAASEEGQAVAEVVYLKKGERAPRSKSAVVIEVVSDRSHESIESGPSGLRMRVKVSSFRSILADLQKKVGADSAQRIYVRGSKPER